MDYQNFLSKFHPIDSTTYSLLESALRTVVFKKGELIVSQGQVEHDLYFVHKGVQMTYYNGLDREHIFSFSYPLSLSGIPDSFLHQVPSEYNLVALTDSELGAISFTKLNELFDESQQLERLFRKMIEAKFIGLITRHKELHTCTIEERFRLFAARSSHLFQLVPHKYIASYLKIDPTNFSKLFNSVTI